MAGKKTKCARGLTLFEVLVATVIIGIAATGVLSYEYHGARQSQLARAYSIAVRVGYFLLEDWKANGGSPLYAGGASGVHNPLDLDIDGQRFEYVSPGVYEITVDNFLLRVSLLRPAEYLELIPIKVKVQWRNSSVVLETYARVDQTGD